MAASALRVAAVLPAAGRAAADRASALGVFLRDRLTLPDGVTAESVTHLACPPHVSEAAAVALAPTPAVRLVRLPAERPDLLAADLAAFHERVGAQLVVLPHGSAGTEVAARLAARTGGSALTGVLSAALGAQGLTCRRATHSGHLVGDVELGPAPWCITVDAGLADAGVDLPADHEVIERWAVSDEDPPEPGPFLEVEPLPAPAEGLDAARFLVVAGRGAGSRDGVARMAAAAAGMGAAFGVTRPVVMNAWAAPDRQIGVSGIRAAPAVCIVGGAAGSPAFLWGVERAGFIAAVNVDGDAPIAAQADAVVVGDAVAVLEALARLLAAEHPDGGPAAAPR